MSLECYTSFSMYSDDEIRIRELYEYFEKCAEGECYLQYYKPDAENDNIEYFTEAYLDGEPQWEDEGAWFHVHVVSKYEPPIDFFKELCDTFFQDAEDGVELIYISENPDAREYITNEPLFQDTYIIDFFPGEDDPEELKVIEEIINESDEDYIDKELIIKKLSPFYPEAETDLDSVLSLIEEKYEEYSIEFIKVEYRDE